MRPSLRVDVTATTATVEFRRGTHVVWEAARTLHIPESEAAEISGDSTGRETFAETLTALLRDVPCPRWSLTPSVIAVVGSHASHVKRLRGLPTITNVRTLELAVRENARQFFLRDHAFVTTSLIRLADTEALGAAIDADVVDAIRTACTNARYPLQHIAPEADTRLTFRPARNTSDSAAIPQGRAIAAVAACVIAMTAAALTPALSATATARRAERDLATLSSSEQAVVTSARHAQRASATLETIGRFERARRPLTLLLAALAEGLPSESAIVTLRADTATVDLVVISTRAAAVLGALDRVPGVSSPEMIGPASRDVINNREMERATIRFRYTTSDTASRVPFGRQELDEGADVE